MYSSKKARVTIKLKTPNPLFEQWLIEWRDKAIEKDSKMQHCFKKALESLRKYPLPLETGRDCKILNGFGEKLCKMLDEKLRQQNGLHPNTAKGSNIEGNQSEYIPKLRSGSYAILVALYKSSLQSHYEGYMLKNDIIRVGQYFCDKSFVRPDPGSFYTAWSSMKTLLDKRLVSKCGIPARFSLTPNGVLLGRKLYKHNLEVDIEQTSKSELEEALSAGAGCSTSQEVTQNRPSRNMLSQVKEGILTTSSSSEIILEPHLVQNLNRCTKSTKSSPSSVESDNQSDIQSEQLSQPETFILLPNTYDIILYVDKQETAGAGYHVLDDVILSELLHLEVKYETKHLKVGDYTWVCREPVTNREVVLPYIIERKRMDDLGASIKDGRFHEQKFRLKQCGIQNVIYLIESHGSNKYAGLPLPTLYQAATNTLVQDNFSVKFTNSTKETAHYLATLTSILKKIFQYKTLVSCPKENLSDGTLDDDLISLMTFKEFNKGASKTKKLKVRDLFARQLLQLRGMSIEKALAIINKYPTPKLLQMAYANEEAVKCEKLLSSIQYGKLGKTVGPVISKVVYQLYSFKKF